MKKTAWIGLDVHKDSIMMAVYIANSPEPKLTQQMSGNPAAMAKLLAQHARRYHLKVCYEAGPCGYTLYRMLAERGIDCMVVAPSLIPDEGRAVKTDRLDAQKLARLLRAGMLTPVTVPDEELESFRDLVRHREELVKIQVRGMQQIRSHLNRINVETPSGKISKQRIEELFRREYQRPLDGMVLRTKIRNYRIYEHQVNEVTQMIEAEAQRRYPEEIAILRAFRGISTVVAATILTHVPDFRAFSSPKRLMSYAGLTSREYSSGGSRRQGGISKAGSRQLRRALIIAAQTYHTSDWSAQAVRARRQAAPVYAREIAERAERRCRKRYRHLIRNNKKANVAKTAVAREMLGFIWEAMMSFHEGELRISA